MGDDNGGGTVEPGGLERGTEEDVGPEGLPRLLARLGRLIERYGPEGVVVVSAEEHERAAVTAYAAGWQDAAAEYGPRIAAARWEGWLGRWRPLRVMEDPGEVIDFPADRLRPDPAGTGDQPAQPGAEGAGEQDRRRRVRGGTPVPRPALTPKNRRSKSPTIPRLPAPERHRPRRTADAPDDAPE
ncbi:hypothetical protein [Actinacidiphila yeochonensis]|uniref:hypothetical protein n=1 Tax=Actinacidiphila yeochonensis TaxID=89050 RepID=UPI00068BE2AE|nr:hypothetical protein [Actinacidiphila yeochonensis]